MDINKIFGVLSVVLALASIYPYLRGIVRGQVRPHLFTWLVWALVLCIGLAAQISDGAGAGAWITAISATFCTTVAIIAFTRGEKNITRTDTIALALALSAIPLWLLTDNPLWSVIIISFIDGIAFVPTIRKSWGKPREESLWAYSLGAAGFVSGIFALDNVSLITALYPAVISILNFAFVAFVLLRRRAVCVA